MKKVLFIMMLGLMFGQTNSFENIYSDDKVKEITINIDDYDISPLSYLEEYSSNLEKQSKEIASMKTLLYSSIGIMFYFKSMKDAEPSDGGGPEFVTLSFLTAGLINFFKTNKKSPHNKITNLYQNINSISDNTLREKAAYLALHHLTEKAEINISPSYIFLGPYGFIAYYLKSKNQKNKSQEVLNNFLNQVSIEN